MQATGTQGTRAGRGVPIAGKPRLMLRHKANLPVPAGTETNTRPLDRRSMPRIAQGAIRPSTRLRKPLNLGTLGAGLGGPAGIAGKAARADTVGTAVREAMAGPAGVLRETAAARGNDRDSEEFAVSM